MSRPTVVRDGRQEPSVSIARVTMAIAAERVEPRRLAVTRSTYLALLECSGEAGGWTRKALADRAGVSTNLLREILLSLAQLGFVREFEDGSIQVVSPAAIAEVALPIEQPIAPVVEPEPDLLGERAEKFFAWHAGRVEPICGRRPGKCPEAIAAAKRILMREADSAAIGKRVEFALGQRFYADKVLKMTDLERWWAKINAAFLANEANGERTPNGRLDVPHARVNYEGERVVIER